MNRLQRIEKSLAPGADRTAFTVGDTVRVHVKVVEGGKERIQVFEGAVIARSGETNRETFTVRKVSYNTGVERIFPVGSPKIDKIEVVRHGRVRRAKLYFLRERRGKRARIAEHDGRGRPGAEGEVLEDVVVPGEDEAVPEDMTPPAETGEPAEASTEAGSDAPAETAGETPAPEATEAPGDAEKAPGPERAEAASGAEPEPETEKKDAG